MAMVGLAGITRAGPFPFMGMSTERTKRSGELDDKRQNSNADAQERAKLDGQLLFHFLNIKFQFSFGSLKLSPDLLNVVL